MTVPGFIETGLTAVLADIAGPVSVISRDFRIVWANGTVLKYVRLGLDRIRGRLCYEVLFGKQQRCVECPVRMVFDSGQAAVLEKCFTDRKGSVIWREVRAYPIGDPTGSIVSAIRFGFDITEKKRLRNSQRRHVEELESALRNLQEAGTDEPVGNSSPKEAYGLTPRERQVLRLLAKGLTNRQISGILCIGHDTVKSHVAHLFNKLGVTRRAQAAAKASLLGLL